MTSMRKKLAWTIGVLFFVLLIAYSAYQGRAYLAGSRITIEHTVVNSSTVDISGSAERVAFLSLNGRQIFTDKNGVWQETILLLPGYNVVTLAATDRFGRKAETHRDFYRPKDTI